MSEIVLRMLALVLQGVKGLILHFPARTTRPQDLFHILCGDFEVGEPREALPFPVRFGFPGSEKVYHQIGV